MTFEKYGDGKYRAFDSKNQILFTTSKHPSEVTGWVQTDVTTKEGYRVAIPKPETVEVAVTKITVEKAVGNENDDLEVDWA